MTKPKIKLDRKEITDEIYDTLVGLVGLSPLHVPFCSDRVAHSEVIASEGIIRLEMGGKQYKITVEQEKRTLRYY